MLASSGTLEGSSCCNNDELDGCTTALSKAVESRDAPCEGEGCAVVDAELRKVEVTGLAAGAELSVS